MPHTVHMDKCSVFYFLYQLQESIKVLFPSCHPSIIISLCSATIIRGRQSLEVRS